MHGPRLRAMLAGVVVTAAWLVAFRPVPALAVDVIAPPPSAYVVRTFGPDPLGSAGPKLALTLDPGHPDGYFGWYVTPVRVRVSADRPSEIRFVWDDPGGRWRPCEGRLLVPEGKHVLYVQAFSGRTAGPLTALEVKVDLRSRPVNGSEFLMLAASAESLSDSSAVTVKATVNPWAGPRVVRVHGTDRYGTCAQIAVQNFHSAPTVIVARGDEFPDALTASGLAGIYSAPIILTRPEQMPYEDLEALTTLKTKKVIVVGGPRAVSDAVITQMRGRGLNVERIGGVDRYETASLIARAVVARGGQKGQAFIARGDLYPDSLAVSPYAYGAKRPILLVRPSQLPTFTAKALKDLDIGEVIITGSDKAVSAGVEDGIKAASVKTSRCAGVDRYETSVEASRYGVRSALGNFRLVGVATGQNFPDALCGGAAVGKLGGVMLMTPKTYLCDVTRSELASNGPGLRDVQVYGSEAALSRDVWDALLEVIR